MNQQLGAIAVTLDSLPSNVAKSLTDVWTTLPVAHGPSPSGSGPVVVVPPQLDRKDFPNVMHWTKELYNSMRKQGTKSEDNVILDISGLMSGASKKSSRQSSKKKSVISCFMEDENGTLIPESEKAAARGKARDFWITLAGQGHTLTTYTKTNIDIKDRYLALMENTYPWLRYCANHWKSAQIWSNHYSDWSSNYFPQSEEDAAAGEIIDVDADDDNSQDGQTRPSKRPQADGETSEPKRR